MSQLFDYIQKNYSRNEPILVSELECAGYTKNNIRQQVMLLTEAGKLRLYDTGVYFIPGDSIFRSGSTLNLNQVIEKKYLYEKDIRCGYYSGLGLANRIGLTTQVPNVYEVTTNKATKDYRVSSIASFKVIIRRPKTAITEKNYRVLQLLDLLKDLELYREVELSEAGEVIRDYARKAGIGFQDLSEYLGYYPDCIYRNMYRVGILRGNVL